MTVIYGVTLYPNPGSTIVIVSISPLTIFGTKIGLLTRTVPTFCRSIVWSTTVSYSFNTGAGTVSTKFKFV